MRIRGGGAETAPCGVSSYATRRALEPGVVHTSLLLHAGSNLYIAQHQLQPMDLF